jgi:hypothetical protein
MNTLSFRQLPHTLFNNTELFRYIRNVRLKMEDGFKVGDVWAAQEFVGRDRLWSKKDKGRAYYEKSFCRYQKRRYPKRRRCLIQESEEQEVEMPVNTPQRYKWLAKLLPAMDHSQADANNQDLLEKAILGEDVLLTPCVLSARNLERLWVRFPELLLRKGNTSFLLCTLAAHNAQSGAFQKLKILHLDTNRQVSWPVNHVVPLFRLPHLTDLTLGNCGFTSAVVNFAGMFYPDDTNSWIWPVRTSTITRLSLLSPWFSGSMAAKMLLACRSITEFELVLPYY